jgi:N-acetylglucosamine-6-phosphate deacetylase
MATTDATAGAGLPYGASATLGGRRITVRETAQLDDGTLAGSVVTMDRVFAMLVTQAGQSLIDAAALCSTTPARELRLASQGTIAVGQMADLVVLSSSLKVEHTWIAGRKTAEPER